MQLSTALILFILGGTNGKNISYEAKPTSMYFVSQLVVKGKLPNENVSLAVEKCSKHSPPDVSLPKPEALRIQPKKEARYIIAELLKSLAKELLETVSPSLKQELSKVWKWVRAEISKWLDSWLPWRKRNEKSAIVDYSGITYNRLGLNVEVKIPSERESSNKIKTSIGVVDEASVTHFLNNSTVRAGSFGSQYLKNFHVSKDKELSVEIVICQIFELERDLYEVIFMLEPKDGQTDTPFSQKALLVDNGKRENQVSNAAISTVFLFLIFIFN